jgi:hypothetical protein
MLPNPFKLEKMKIKAFDSEARVGKYNLIEVMFNPTSYALSFGNKYVQKPSIGGKKTKPQISHAQPRTLQLDFVIDGTGVTNLGIENLLGTQTVSERISEFFQICVESQSETHQPKFLRLQWGNSLAFDCRVSNVQVSYSLFDNDGSPLRAKLSTTFIEDVPEEEGAKKTESSSPDLTHVRIVKAGDTLPLMVKEIYGSFEHVQWLARANDLDQFRKIEPGKKLLFPPLEK